jgi:protein-S-isoprenylcysteine O-methyltransferase Ste14
VIIMLTLFVFILVIDFLLLSGIVISIFFPNHRIWPPPKKDSWQFWVSWILFDFGMIGSGLIGIIDYEIFSNEYWIRILVGGLVVIIGGGLVLWGIRTLSMHQSLGLKGKLVTEGPYQYSRNPQYVGFILMYAGITLVTYSFMALVTGTIMIVMFAILPFSEEPWLRQQYGKAYVEYCKQVPRFIDPRSFKPKILNKIPRQLEKTVF